MPEGDTLLIVAQRLAPVLEGQEVRALQLRPGQGSRFGPPRGPLREVPRWAGRRVERVHAVGKHLLIEAGGEVLRVHLGMSGSWHRYAPGEPWQRPEAQAGVVLRVDGAVVVCFRPPTVSLGSVCESKRELAALGPDLADEAVDWEAVRVALEARAAAPLWAVLLDQRVAAGFGNVYKSEVLFLHGLHPERRVGEVGVDRVLDAMRAGAALLRENVRPGMRSTTGERAEGRRLWVYGRAGEPCRRCGAPIAVAHHGDPPRVSTWCPACQPREPSG